MRACVPADLGLIGSCEGNRPVKCSLGSVKRGTHATVKPVVKTTRGGRLVDAGSVDGREPDPRHANDSHADWERFFLNTYSRATGLGQALTRTGLHAKSAQVMVEMCPTCGSIKIYWNGSLKHTHSLKASRVQHRQARHHRRAGVSAA